MSKNKNNRISPANIVAVISVAALGVVSFFGALFLSKDGTPGGPAITAAAFAFGIGLLLIFCIATKTCESEFKKWRVVEYVCFVAYLAVAVVCYKPFLQFFHVVQNKESLQKMAQNEIDSIKSMCKTYNEEAEKAVELATTQFKNFEYRKDDYDTYTYDTLPQYYNKRITKLSTWSDVAKANVRFDNYDAELNKLSELTESWNFMELSSIAVQLETKYFEVWSSLDTHIKKNKTEQDLIPVIEGGLDGESYYLAGLKNFDIGPQPEKSAFSAKFRQPVSGFNYGIIIYIILHLLVLANYFLVRRSPIIEIKRNNEKDENGLPLEIEA